MSPGVDPPTGLLIKRRCFHFHNFPPKLRTRFVYQTALLDQSNKRNSHWLVGHLWTRSKCVTGAVGSCKKIKVLENEEPPCTARQVAVSSYFAARQQSRAGDTFCGNQWQVALFGSHNNDPRECWDPLVLAFKRKWRFSWRGGAESRWERAF